MLERNSVSGIGEISNENASVELIPSPGGSLYFIMDSLGISVSKAAKGGDGEVIVKDTAGNVIWRTNADGVKDFSVNCGKYGVRIGPGVGVVATVANARGEQATASVVVTGCLYFH